MEIDREVKKKYREMINQGKHKDPEIDLNYIIAVSSGIKVSEEIPAEAYKRASWASNQGASFIELYLGGPAQIYNEWDNLLSISRQLGLSFDAHFPVNIPFDYSNPNRGRREHMGFFRSHEFMYEFIKAWGQFKIDLDRQTDINDNHQTIYGINAHLVKSNIPELKERMASDVAVDPFGDPIKQSRIFQNPDTRRGFFLDYIWDELKDNFDIVQGMASNIEGFTDYNEIFQNEIIEHMESNGYLNEKMLRALSNIGNPEKMVENIDYLLKKQKDIVEIDERSLRNYIQSEHIQEEVMDLTERGKDLRKSLNDDGPVKTYRELKDDEKENYIKNYKYGRDGGEMLRQSAIRNIAGVSVDIPEEIEELKNHREGSSIARNIPRFNPEHYRNSRWSEFIPEEIWERKKDLTDQSRYQKEMDKIVDKVKQEIKKAILARLGRTDNYIGGKEDGVRNREPFRSMSWGEVTFRDIINFRGGYFEDHLNRESTIYWYILPWWMPFSEEEKIREIWDNINPDLSSKKIKDWTEHLKKLRKKRMDKDPDDYEERDDKKYHQIIAAGAGAYVWGHFTQYIGRGQEITLVEMLDEYNLTLDWEAHNSGAEGENKLWKPRNIIKVCKAVNDTKVNGKKREVLNCTIDAEHLAMNGVDPLWVIDGNKDKDFKGLEDGDGKLITKQHITHPALSESQHHHQPIRRGDTYVYRQIYSLVDKGFCKISDRPSILLYELGGEKAESVFMLRLMMNMIEMGIKPEDIEGENADMVWRKLENGEEITLKDYTILKFFGLTEEEWHHEWQEIFEHALDPLNGLLETTQPDHTWSGSAALERDNQPDKWKREEYR